MDALIGTGVALVTPFREDLSIDVPALERIVEHCINGGIDYLVALGTTAETATLTKAEKRLVLDTIVRVNAERLPLAVGVGGNNTAQVVDDLKTMDLEGFSAILSVSPYYNKPTQEGIYQHFKAISEASRLPIILYNVPSRTGSNMLPETTLRLAHDFENIVAVKEACGNMQQIETIIQKRPNGFLVLSGDDSNALATVLAGGNGVISVLGQGIPDAMSRMIRMGLEGDRESAHALHDSLSDGMQLIFEEGNPAGIKSIFEHLQLSGAKVRLPLVEASPQLKTKINDFMVQRDSVPA